MKKRKRLTKEVKIGRIVLRYNKSIENHIAKHNVKIKDVVKSLSNDYLLRKIKDRNWVAIAKHPESGRYLTIFLYQIRKLEFRIKTVRDSTDAEKRLYKKHIK